MRSFGYRFRSDRCRRFSSDGLAEWQGRASMNSIRPLEPDDLPAVAALYERTMRSGSSTPAPGLIEHLRRLLEHPWSDPELPSLVYVDEDAGIAAFLGSHPRRVWIDGREGRLACSGQLVADERSRKRAVGALVLRTYVGGPQDLSITDGATIEMRRIWGRMGGVTAQLRSLDWIKILRPGAFAARHHLDDRRDQWRGRVLRRLARGPDAILARVVRRQLASDAARDVTVEPLTPELALEHLPALVGRVRLRLAYDLPYLRWLLGELSALTTRGRLAATLLRARDGRVLGWYIAHVRHDDTAFALQIAARERDAGTVLEHLFCTARDAGATAVRGRVEPQLLDPLVSQGVVLRHAGSALVHSTNPDTAALASSSQSFLTLLDGEYWMEPHLL